jgi:dienelactone hydrolase
MAVTLLAVFGAIPIVQGHSQMTAGWSVAESEAVEFVEQMEDGQFQSAVNRFHADLRNEVSARDLQEDWAEVKSVGGALLRWTDTRWIHMAEGYAVIVTLEFAVGPLDLEVAFDRGRHIIGYHFLLHRDPPDEVRDTEYVLGDHTRFPATLSQPRKKGSHPGVVLLHDAGNQYNRDGRRGANRWLYQEFAWALAERGLAVLRFGRSEDIYAERIRSQPTSSPILDEVEPAIAFLRTVQGVDTSRIIVVGHGTTGHWLPVLAKRDSALDGIVIMAGPTRPMEAMRARVSYLMSLEELSEADRRSLSPVKDASDRILALEAEDSSRTDTIFGFRPRVWLSRRKLDVLQVAGEVRTPMLILQGSRDYQVSLVEFNRWRMALEDSAHVRLIAYPDLNHLFVKGAGPSTPSDMDRTGRVASEVVRDIAQWAHDLPGSP